MLNNTLIEFNVPICEYVNILNNDWNLSRKLFFEDMRKQIVRVRKNKHKWKIRTSRVELKTEKGNRSLPTLPKYLRLWPRYDFKRHNISNDSLRALTM